MVYTVEELNNYFDNIEGFASYCFNLSHAAALLVYFYDEHLFKKELSYTIYGSTFVYDNRRKA